MAGVGRNDIRERNNSKFNITFSQQAKASRQTEDAKFNLIEMQVKVKKINISFIWMIPIVLL